MSKIINSAEEVSKIFNRYLEAVWPSADKARELLQSGRRLTFYLGIDPTGPDIHLGHTTNLLFLKKLLALGHRLILLIGDFTAQIGDPTGKDTTRKPLTELEIKENLKTYLNQIKKVIPLRDLTVKYNSAWLKKLSLKEILQLASRVTVQQMIAREMFQRRLAEQKPIGLHEFLYPLMQGYDSVAMAVDGEVGGNDQTFNMLVGRDLLRTLCQKEKIVFATKLLEDPISGQKLMNKSGGRYISLNDSAQEMFGKTMSLPDPAIIPLFRYATEMTDEAIMGIEKRLEQGENPKNIKAELAKEIVRMYYGEAEAARAESDFQKVFQEGQIPEKMEEIKITNPSHRLIDWLLDSGVVSSRGEIKRLISQKAVEVEGQVVEDWNYEVAEKEAGVVVRLGTHRFYRFRR